ncbi:DNA-binding transcriptional regulator [Brachybacterium sp. P6-10-X1]|uniref:helix-turn-helix transcriptional regulator n=1 Tax=Brachybacterium sp. P6-10-X1 TaxID=1903186 RepID=UPI000971A57E|nr:WYL domain-containing protein [Brachybacterium sp. P6-10-X1]APX32629.1 DNA-binding transcriptional regulator [Brachybacterium sp. P6-10-X1]
MTDPTARALHLLDVLQSAPMRTGAELVERLGVDERTVRRDVARLVDLGLPVESLRGRYGGYRLAPGRRVLPLMFSSEEAVAVLVGLAGARAASEDPDLAAQTALSKIRRALAAPDAERVDDVLGTITRRGEQPGPTPDPAVMLTLAEAVAHRRPLDLRYRNRTGEPSRRIVHPTGVVAHARRWYLLALDPDAQQEKSFRLDRIRTARTLPGTFAPSPRADPATAGERADPADRLIEHFVAADHRWKVVLRLRATEDQLRAHLPSTVARLERLGPAADVEGESDVDSDVDSDVVGEGVLPWYRAEIRAEHLDWIPAVLAALDCPARIEHPEELRDLVTATASRMLRAAADPGG